MEKKINPMKGKQTKGLVTVGPEQDSGLYVGAVYVASCWPGDDSTRKNEESAANAALYAEAHNVANSFGMWPREMQARIEELESFIRKHHPHAPQCAVMLEPVLAENFCSCGRYALLTPNTGTDGKQEG